jgi:hypothetical protein
VPISCQYPCQYISLVPYRDIGTPTFPAEAAYGAFGAAVWRSPYAAIRLRLQIAPTGVPYGVATVSYLVRALLNGRVMPVGENNEWGDSKHFCLLQLSSGATEFSYINRYLPLTLCDVCVTYAQRGDNFDGTSRKAFVLESAATAATTTAPAAVSRLWSQIHRWPD